jgi:hypothetical protein
MLSAAEWPSTPTLLLRSLSVRDTFTSVFTLVVGVEAEAANRVWVEMVSPPWPLLLRRNEALLPPWPLLVLRNEGLLDTLDFGVWDCDVVFESFIRDAAEAAAASRLDCEADFRIEYFL